MDEQWVHSEPKLISMLVYMSGPFSEASEVATVIKGLKGFVLQTFNIPVVLSNKLQSRDLFRTHYGLKLEL